MSFPTKWQSFRKRYIDLDRYGDYRTALQEVSAQWAIVKVLRAAGLPGWQDIAKAQIQARRDAHDQRLDAERDRLAAEERERQNNAALLEKDAIDVTPFFGPSESVDSLWRGGWQLGGRDLNKATIWLRINAQGEVADRRVLKDTVLNAGTFVDLTRWSGPDLRDLQGRVHVEFTHQESLCEAPAGGQNFVRVRGYRNFPQERMYRTIQDFADGQDLDGLRKRHSLPVPEPLIWRLLEQLAESAVVMEQGSLTGPVPGWQQIVHYDIKSANVFLAKSKVPGAIYPDVKLGDFEMSVRTSETDPFNPEILRDITTCDIGWMAPEMRSDDCRWMCTKVAGRDLGYIHEERILSPANIWGIGACMFELMNGQVRITHYDSEGDPDGMEYRIVYWSEMQMKHEDPLWEQWEPAALGTYSGHLVQAVKSCLADDPNARITPNALLALVNGPVPDDHADGPEDRRKAEAAKASRDGRNVDGQWTPFIDSVDPYRVGLTLQGITATMFGPIVTNP